MSNLYEEGIESAKREIAAKMIRDGLDESKIQRYTGLSRVKIEDISKRVEVYDPCSIPNELLEIKSEFVKGRVCPVCFGEGSIQHSQAYEYKAYNGGNMKCYYCMGFEKQPLLHYLSFPNSNELRVHLEKLCCEVISYRFNYIQFQGETKWEIPRILFTHPHIDLFSFCKIHESYLLTFILLSIKEKRGCGIKIGYKDIAFFLRLIKTSGYKEILFKNEFPETEHVTSYEEKSIYSKEDRYPLIKQLNKGKKEEFFNHIKPIEDFHFLFEEFAFSENFKRESFDVKKWRESIEQIKKLDPLKLYGYEKRIQNAILKYNIFNAFLEIDLPLEGF